MVIGVMLGAEKNCWRRNAGNGDGGGDSCFNDCFRADSCYRFRVLPHILIAYHHS
jgi:hypothetical protein